MKKDMTTGSPLRLIVGFAVPLMLGSLFQQFYSLADTIIVGRFLGVEALAAVGSTGSLNYLVLGCAIGVCCGFSIPVAQRFGAKDYSEMRRYFANALKLTALLSLILTVLTVTFTRAILEWMQSPDNLIDMAVTYIRMVFIGISATLLYNIVSAMMRALGDSKHPLYFLVFASFLNVALDLLFILVFNLGVFGAALATIVAQAVAGLASLAYFWRAFPELHATKQEAKFSAAHCKHLLYIGVPMGLQCSITGLGCIILQSAVNGLGSVVVAAQTAGGRVSGLLVVPLDSIGTTMATYCSQNLGAKRLDRVRSGVWQGLGFGAAYSITAALIVRFVDVFLIELFVDSTEVEIIAGAQEFLHWNSIFYVALAALIVYRYTIQGMGFSGVAMLAGVTEMLARIIVAAWCSGENGFFWVCMSNPASWFLAAVVLMPLYFIIMRRLHCSAPQPQA